jgi:hypothetical protein
MHEDHQSGGGVWNMSDQPEPHTPQHNPQPVNDFMPSPQPHPHHEAMQSVYPQAPLPQPAPVAPEPFVHHEPAAPSLSASSATSDLPVPVVQVLSVRGVEYTMMTLMLWFAAGSLIGILLSLFNGGTDFAILSFPLALLLVCVPGFAFLFLRLKKAELANPALRMDASKRRLSQFTQVIAFAVCLFNVIALVYTILSAIGGESVGSLGKTFLNVAVMLVVAGGVLAYYWIDEHRAVKG